MITHTVVFKLKHNIGSAEEAVFLEKAKALASLETVENFKVVKQVSAKNPYTFALFMDFQSQQAFEDYNDHPKHIDFVKNVWLVEVEKFMELDYVVLDG